MTIIDDDMAGLLLGVVESAAEPVPMRAKAAISLGPVLESADMDGFDDPDDLPISESTFHRIQQSLQATFRDQSVPKEVRRRVLEASVRAPEEWHKEAIETAYSSGDREWILTSVFAMMYVSGFDRQILEALKNPDPDIHFEAVRAAGEQEVDGAWGHVLKLVENPRTKKSLRLAAIAALGTIRPAKAGEILVDLATSDDEEIAEAAEEAMSMAEAISGIDDDEDDEDE
jgi:hypothetical protein